MRITFVKTLTSGSHSDLAILVRGHYCIFKTAAGEEIVYAYHSGLNCMSDFISILANNPVNIGDFVVSGSFVPLEFFMHNDDGTLKMDMNPQAFLKEDDLRAFFRDRPRHLPEEELIRLIQAVEGERMRILQSTTGWDETCQNLKKPV